MDNKEEFAQIDFIWVAERLTKRNINIETDTHSKFPSDHYPLIATLKLRLEKREEIEGNSNTKWKAVQKPYHVEKTGPEKQGKQKPTPILSN